MTQVMTSAYVTNSSIVSQFNITQVLPEVTQPVQYELTTTQDYSFFYSNLAPLIIISAVVALMLSCTAFSAYIKWVDNGKRRNFCTKYFCCWVKSKPTYNDDDMQALTQQV